MLKLRALSPRLFVLKCLVGAAIGFAGTGEMAAQTPAVLQETFPFEIGHSAMTRATYAVNATQPAASKLTGQRIRLKVAEPGFTGTTTRYFTLATGKYKTVAQLDAVLVETFRRFLATPPPAANQEIGKVGDLQHGGEVRFVAQSPDDLRFDNLAPNAPARVVHYSRADVAAFVAALTGTPAS